MDSRVRIGELPANSLLLGLKASGAYVDCYLAELPCAVSHAHFVQAFYTGRLFNVERLLIRLLLKRASTDAEVRLLADGQLQTFAAWRVEARATNQILLADLSGHTRSWLMVEALDPAQPSIGTRLYFGSALMPARNKERARTLGPRLVFSRLMMRFHKLYSRLLLRAAVARLSP